MLIELYQKDRLFRLIANPIMASRSRMNYKRDALRSALREAGIEIEFEMSQLRRLHWFLFPEDARGQVVKKSA